MSKTDYQTADSREPAKELTLQQLVIDTVESGNRTHMCSLCDCLWMHKDEYAVFGWIELLNNAILRATAVGTKKTKVTREQFRSALIRLFEKCDEDRKPLFFRKTHWVAVMRVAVDAELVRENIGDFTAFVKALKICTMKIPLSQKGLSNAYIGIYRKVLREWSEQAYLNERDGKGQPSYYREMERIAMTLQNEVQNGKNHELD